MAKNKLTISLENNDLSLNEEGSIIIQKNQIEKEMSPPELCAWYGIRSFQNFEERFGSIKNKSKYI